MQKVVETKTEFDWNALVAFIPKNHNIELFRVLKLNDRRFYQDPHLGNLLTLYLNNTGRADAKVVRQLIEYGNDPETPNKWGYTPLHLACNFTQPSFTVVKCLLEAGCDPNRLTNEE